MEFEKEFGKAVTRTDAINNSYRIADLVMDMSHAVRPIIDGPVTRDNLKKIERLNAGICSWIVENTNPSPPKSAEPAASPGVSGPSPPPEAVVWPTKWIEMVEIDWPIPTAPTPPPSSPIESADQAAEVAYDAAARAKVIPHPGWGPDQLRRMAGELADALTNLGRWAESRAAVDARPVKVTVTVEVDQAGDADADARPR